MDFFYNLNKKLNSIRELPETTHKQLNESKPDFLDLDRDGNKSEPMKKAAKEKPDYKSKMQDKFGGSASDLTKGLTTKSKKVNESAHSIRDVLAYEIEMILDGAAAGDDQTDHIVDELGDIFNDIKASRDKAAMMAYEMMVDTIDEDAGIQAVAARKALALLKNNSAGMAEGNYSKDAMELNPDFAKVGRKPGVMGKIAQGVKKVADFVAPGDEDLMRDLERKSGGRRPAKEAAAPMSAKQKSFAALAEPKDKITFADKIAGAKKEVDEMLGDVAAEAMKAALGKGKQPTMGEATKEIPGGRRHTSEPGGYGRKDDEDAPRVQTQRSRGRPKKNADSETGQVMKPDFSAFGVTGKDIKLPKHKGAVTKHKMVGESPDQQQVQQIYNDLAEIRAAAKQAQRGGQFPQGFATQLESVLWSAMTLIKNQQPGNAQVSEGAGDDDRKVLERLMDEAFADGKTALGNAIQGVLEMMSDDEEPVNEKAVSKKQQRFMGMVHAAKKGEKPASKEVAKAAKGISAKEADKFASTKHKGLPEKAKEGKEGNGGAPKKKETEFHSKLDNLVHKTFGKSPDEKKDAKASKSDKSDKKEKPVKETTVSGSVATAPAAGGKKSAGGFSFGQGVYEARLSESYNRQLNAMLNESMNVSMSDSTEGGRSLTVTATEEDAAALSDLLKMAGMFSSNGYKQVSRDGSSGCSECGMHGGVHEASCGHRDMVEEELANSANNTGYADTDTMVNKLSGGLNGPKLQVNPNNKGDNPLAMRDLGRSSHSLNLGQVAENVELEAQKSLWNLYKGIK